MLVLSNISALLSQLLSPPAVHTSMLLTPQGVLVAFAAMPGPVSSEDRVKAVVGLGGQIWRERVGGVGVGDDDDGDGGEDEGEGGGERDEEWPCMAECELGRLLVLPIFPSASPSSPSSSETPRPALPRSHTHSSRPALVLVLNATGDVPWGLLRLKGIALAEFLSERLALVGDQLTAPPVQAPASRRP
ncbi:hypothetical protein BOTBODRAFT_54461 [Botryobasidium botryosum FD-172 SS1]|uniref:Roadblock/LAMTOR2 domain-containing protein n=1 Tax=Botryobasidium botryosum (strain FD-172 SS1) TaxID=930990 RepID=A0A067MVF4_BOTB1|nr:hypothetical protein BOTBODRAFT_54461 [Botryobasidium botryosum FD-172 SS1]